jgi:Predicted integral membrane protein
MRYALAGYVLLIVYASLYPFSGWRWQGLMPFDFALAPLPRYITFSDLLINVGGYLPLGYLIARNLPARWPRWASWLAASVLASSVSFGMEASQAFLPMRVSSNLDWLTNSLGGLLGAAICVWLLPRLRLAALLRLWRERWFAPHVGYGLLLLALWPLALLWPAAVLFGTGQIGPTLLQPALDTDTWRFCRRGLSTAACDAGFCADERAAPERHYRGHARRFAFAACGAVAARRAPAAAGAGTDLHRPAGRQPVGRLEFRPLNTPWPGRPCPPCAAWRWG